MLAACRQLPTLPAQVRHPALHCGGLHPGGTGPPEGAAATAGGCPDGNTADGPLLMHPDPHVCDRPWLAPLHAGEPLAGMWPLLALGLGLLSQGDPVELGTSSDPPSSWTASLTILTLPEYLLPHCAAVGAPCCRVLFGRAHSCLLGGFPVLGEGLGNKVAL